MEGALSRLLAAGQSALILGPRQVGKTTLVKRCLEGLPDVLRFPLQDPEVRLALERDPALIIKRVAALGGKRRVFIDEAQKVPALFDSVQYLIDERLAAFVLTGSSARKLRRGGANLLPGRVKSFRLDPLSWNELGWIAGKTLVPLRMENLNTAGGYSFEKSQVFGSLPGIVSLAGDDDRRDFLKAYTHIYLEEEIRAEALSRKIGAFSRFLELAAAESGTSPNFAKLSMEAGVSAPAIKDFYAVLEDTLIVERLDPYMRNARKRVLSSPRYFFFDLGVRNVLARMPLGDGLLQAQKGVLFEHAVILEILRRIRALNKEAKAYFWRTSGGAEVDCVVDTGAELIPIEIKAGRKASAADARGLASFLQDYPAAKRGYIVNNGAAVEQVARNIIAVPWRLM